MLSTVIHAYQYDPRTNRLSVTFVSGRAYIYRDVPAVIYAGLVRASSKGAFFNTFIRNRYPFERVAPASAA